MDNNIRLKMAHIKLIRSRDTYAYGSVLMLGESKITDDPKIETAGVRGIDKFYNDEYVSTLSDAQLRGVVMHETLHVALMHPQRFKHYLNDPNDLELMNTAMDIQVNNIIHKFTDKTLCALPGDPPFIAKYDGWDTLEIFNDLRKQQDQPDPQKPDGDNQNGTGFDTHEAGRNSENKGDGEGESEDSNADYRQEQQQMEQIRTALLQGGTLAAMQGHELPRELDMTLANPHDWRDEVKEFAITTTKGTGEASYEKYNRKRIIDDIYLPTDISETVKELIFAIDVSGSISQNQLSKAAAVISDACVQVMPERVRVLFWDTEIRNEQVFTENYDNISKLLKPTGGGGTQVGCVANYIVKRKLTPDCIIILTDGYVESNISWPISVPSLWLIVDNGTKNFKMPPSGRFVKMTRG